ncbi:DsbE family thiol:disulfide interchange protein [Tepidamorphus sp. 3E244]|uniref:DsbE family thiol:disulfide interchange protein n=1 Tax=Tepidamorphus sp. 3E244 TaxID=3385498 RepID=UPI0038FCC739
MNETLSRALIIIPLVVFLSLAGLFYYRLDAGDPSKVPSALIGREAPEFQLDALPDLTGDNEPVPGFSRADLNGAVSVVNVWASWCVPCRDEHPFMVELSKDDRFKLYGLNYKDKADNARRFLGRYGNPYDAVGTDQTGRVGIDWGVYGVPETFIVDARGRVAYKHVGPINKAILEQIIMPKIEETLVGTSSQ